MRVENMVTKKISQESPYFNSEILDIKTARKSYFNRFCTEKIWYEICIKNISAIGIPFSLKSYLGHNGSLNQSFCD